MKRAIPLALVWALAGCAGYDRFVEYETVAPESFPVLTATGIAPLSAQLGNNEQEKMRRAMRAAKLDAYRELAEQVYGQRIQGQSEVDNLVLSSDRFRAQVDGVIRGAKVVRSYPVGDSYVTELELDYQLVWELYQQQPRQRVKSVSYY
ncbi:LPP20 family lipoprotein [Ferrimonas balearica]|uniref:LPP20 family lipoprotein n=1 Tax=Ferrimonas balearica TaxID=44012 RepID=UPI001C98EA3E|nr:LPP20 family lipoprotein [Ferrimonas balearica]MBY5992923.1 LPP20 family lipoprotein [Ferrimonas balearica]